MTAKLQTDFITLNAQFMDALLKRWEAVIEHAIHMAHGKLDQADKEAAHDAFLTTLLERDQELKRWRDLAKARHWSFPLDHLANTSGLGNVERHIFELSLMPQLDLTFRRRVARYNNNVLLKFVDVDLLVRILFPERSQQLTARRYFADDAVLMKNQLISLRRHQDAKGDGLIAQEVTVPERWADYVLCRRSVDTSLKIFSTLSDPQVSIQDVSMPEGEKTELIEVTSHFRNPNSNVESHFGSPFMGEKGLAVALVGTPGTGKSMLAEAVAESLGRPLITVDSATLAGDGRNFVVLIEAIFTEARVQGAVLAFDRCEALLKKDNIRIPPLISRLEKSGGLTFFITNRPDELDASLEHYIGYQVVMGLPEAADRAAIWAYHLPKETPIHPEVDLEALGMRFEITGGQIASACELAKQRLSHAPSQGLLTQDILYQSAQAQIRANMDDLSDRSRVNLSLDDLILPDREKGMIEEVLRACRNRIFVMTKWGFGKRLATGKGIAMLFKGPPGTGKTLCAEILSSELGIGLYRVSIPKLVSKYVGETEKNISKIFAAARANHSMLLFDEADSLFGKRVTNVESSVDRFSNMETNLLLQEIERFEGIIILTTNLDKNMDDAFARRIMFKIDFPEPSIEHRALIWKKLIPKDCPIDENIDFEVLGESFDLSGGNIKNAVIRAAYRAAERRDLVRWEDIQFAAEKECIAAGKLFRLTSHREWG